jgi:hypothetical protein
MQVQARMHLLPAEDLPYLDPAHDDHASIMELVRVSHWMSRALLGSNWSSRVTFSMTIVIEKRTILITFLRR